MAVNKKDLCVDSLEAVKNVGKVPLVPQRQIFIVFTCTCFFFPLVWERPFGLIQHVLTILVFWSWVLQVGGAWLIRTVDSTQVPTTSMILCQNNSPRVILRNSEDISRPENSRDRKKDTFKQKKRVNKRSFCKTYSICLNFSYVSVVFDLGATIGRKRREQ